MSVTTQLPVNYGTIIYVDNMEIFVDSTDYYVDGTGEILGADATYPSPQTNYDISYG